MMVSGDKVEFHEGIRRIVSYVFCMYKTLLVYNEMVDVDFGSNRRDVGWGK